MPQSDVAAVEPFDDVLRGIDAISTVVNVGTGQWHDRPQAGGRLRRVFGQPVPTRPGGAVGAFANMDKARGVLSWSSNLTLPDAIDSALAWAPPTPRDRRAFPAVELLRMVERLGSSRLSRNCSRRRHPLVELRGASAASNP
jgi:hypothetical protein